MTPGKRTACLMAAVLCALSLGVATAPARSTPPQLACTRFVNASNVSAALGVAVLPPSTGDIGSELHPGGKEAGATECDFSPVTPTDAYPAGDGILKVVVQAGVSRAQFRRFVRTQTSKPYASQRDGTLRRPSGLGSDAELFVDNANYGKDVELWVLKGNDLFTVASNEVPPASVEAVAAVVYAGI
jgi:hypothetical protein